MKKTIFCIDTSDFKKTNHTPLSAGEAKLIINTLETSREYEEADWEKSVRAKNLAYNYLRKRGIEPRRTVEENLRFVAAVM